MADTEGKCDKRVADTLLRLAWRTAICHFHLFITAEIHRTGVSCYPGN